MSTNTSASIKAKLLNKARIELKPFNEILQYYAMERFLYRLSVSPHKDNFILKGALMLRAWEAPDIRPTMDIDMLGITSNEIEDITAKITEILSIDFPQDGLIFDTKSITAEAITEDADYHGVRVCFASYLGKAKINMQIDIGFDDIVYPGVDELELPTVLDMPAPKLLGYSKESAIAEKFQAIVKLGIINSRMKDFYDIWMLSRQYEFDKDTLAEALRLTFQQRNTELTTNIVAFTDEFMKDKQVQWKAFRKRLQLEHGPESFEEIIQNIKVFLESVI